MSILRYDVPVVQLEECWFPKPKVEGSSPFGNAKENNEYLEYYKL